MGVFFRGFLEHPDMVASVIPSSRVTIDAMLAKVDWQRCQLFVEYGPGVGTFCPHILDRLPPGGQLLVIDTNPRFIDYLRQYHPADSIGIWEEVLLAPNERINLLTNYNSDRPQGTDRLDIQAEVDALASLVAARNVVPPLSIGLFGDWGSGKSFFMHKMIERVSWICNTLPSGASSDTPSFYKHIVQIEFKSLRVKLRNT